VTIPADKEVKVWDSSAQIRWFVIPEQPARSEHLNEEHCCTGHTGSHDGVALVPSPHTA